MYCFVPLGRAAGYLSLMEQPLQMSYHALGCKRVIPA